MNKETENQNQIEQEAVCADTEASTQLQENDALKDDVQNEKNNKNSKSKSKKGRGRIRAFFGSRRARKGSAATAIIAVALAVVAALNIGVGLLTDSFPWLKLDMTESRRYALQDETVQYMSKLEKDVTVTVLMAKKDFENGGTYLAQSNALLQKMQSSSKGKLKLEYVDLSKNPKFTSKYTDVDWTDSSQNYMIVVESGDQYRVLKLRDCFDYDEQTYYYYGTPQITATKIEQAVVTAVLNVTTENKPIVNVIKGNQEQDYSAIVSLLGNNAYSVNEISLATGDLDRKAAITFLYAPSVDLDKGAVEKLSVWLENDGKYGKTLIFVPTADMPESPNLDSLLSDWGMKIDTGYVFETDAQHLVSSSSPYAFILEYTDYYKDGLKNPNIPVAVTESHAVKITDENNAHPILVTSDNAGIYPLDAKDDWDYTKAVTGEPISVAAEGIKTDGSKAQSKLIVFGSYIMFSPNVMKFNSYNNSAYLLNVANTVSGKDDVEITVESKAIDNTELGSTNVAVNTAMMIIFVIVVPAVVIIVGIIVWIRRKNK